MVRSERAEVSALKVEPLAVSIEEAARIVGVSRSQFYRLYLNSGRIKTIPMGRRRMVDVRELHSAYELLAEESRAHE